jgi:hypothetical protein
MRFFDSSCNFWAYRRVARGKGIELPVDRAAKNGAKTNAPGAKVGFLGFLSYAIRSKREHL